MKGKDLGLVAGASGLAALLATFLNRPKEKPEDEDEDEYEYYIPDTHFVDSNGKPIAKKRKIKRDAPTQIPQSDVLDLMMMRPYGGSILLHDLARQKMRERTISEDRMV
jgi:hypothetical protein